MDAALFPRTVRDIPACRDALLERLAMLRGRLEYISFIASDFRPQAAFVDNLIERLRGADLVAWRPDLYSAALRGHEAFLGTFVTLDRLPTLPQIWYTPGQAQEIDSGEHVYDQAAIALCADQGKARGACLGIYILFTREEDAPDPDCPRLFITSMEADEPLLHESNTPLYAGLEFMAQEFVESQQEAASRPDRRRYERQGRSAPCVRSIVLRRQPGQTAGSREQREHEISWMVRGHWRRLHVPRKADGAQVTYIRPFVKGDPEKPLLPPKENLINVRR